MISNVKIKFKTDSHREVLNLIRMHKEISGAELARLTDYQPSTVVYILRHLEDSGYIEVSRIGSSMGSAGKPPTLWKLVSDCGYIIGIEVLPEQIRVIVIDFANNIIHQEINKSFKDINYKKIISGFKDFIESLVDKLSIPKQKVVGIGIAIPGLVDQKNGVVLFSRNLHIKDLPMKKELEDVLDLPVDIANDSNAGALGIKWHSNINGDFPPNIIFLSINEGVRDIGAGLILNNKLYVGGFGTAGELATSLPAISKLMKQGMKKHGKDYPVVKEYLESGDFSISNVAKYCRQNCQFSNFILRNISKYITKEILRIIEFINPNAIVIGGDISEAEFIMNDYIIPSIEKKAHKMFPVGIQIPDIHFSPFGSYSVSVGATALVLRNIFV